MAGLGTHDEIDVTLAHAVLVGQRLVRDRQWPQCLRGDPPTVGEHRQFAALGGDDLALHEHQVTAVDVGLPGGEHVGADTVERQHDLQLGLALAQPREAELAGVADEDDAAGHPDGPAGVGVGLELRVLRADLGQRGRPGHADREGCRGRVGREAVVLLPADAQLLGQVVDVGLVRHIGHPANLARRPEAVAGATAIPLPRRASTGQTARHEFPPAGGGVRLTALSKTFRTPGGPLHAVRGVDLTSPPARRSRCWDPTAPGSRRRSTCCWACRTRTPARSRCSARTPAERDRRRRRGRHAADRRPARLTRPSANCST